MNLLDIKQYLMQVKIASLSSLCAYFNCDSDRLRNMLTHWVRKGCVRQCATMLACSKPCSMKCTSSKNEIYEWVV